MAINTETGQEVDETTLGLLTGMSSEEDGCRADMGHVVGLGNGFSLMIGEITKDRYESAGDEATELGDDFGHWIVLYGPTEAQTVVIGKAVSPYVGLDMASAIAGAISRARSKPDAVMPAQQPEQQQDHQNRDDQPQ